MPGHLVQPIAKNVLSNICSSQNSKLPPHPSQGHRGISAPQAGTSPCLRCSCAAFSLDSIDNLRQRVIVRSPFNFWAVVIRIHSFFKDREGARYANAVERIRLQILVRVVNNFWARLSHISDKSEYSFQNKLRYTSRIVITPYFEYTQAWLCGQRTINKEVKILLKK